MLDVGFNFLKLFLVVHGVWLHFVCHLGARICPQFGSSCFLPHGAIVSTTIFFFFFMISLHLLVNFLVLEEQATLDCAICNIMHTLNNNACNKISFPSF
jgi:hypothetical protein